MIEAPGFAVSSQTTWTICCRSIACSKASRSFGFRSSRFEVFFGFELKMKSFSVTAGTWWFNLRPSNTEPLLRLNVEADTEATMTAVRDEVLGVVRGYTDIGG